MSLQISEIILYAHDGRTRSIHFVRGKLNILAGPPLRGKTQLIEIVDYCLGRGTPNLAPGPITERVAWFALRLSLDTEEVFIARRAGHDGAKTSEEVYFDRATAITVPGLANLRSTHNVETLIDELDGLLGIQQNQVKVLELSGRDPFKATTRHAILLCFQAQHEIANPSMLFHRQSESQGSVGRDLLATMPYFLGAISEQSVTVEAEATRVRRELRVAERRYREEELLTQDRRSRANSLYSEAVGAGLVAEAEAWQSYDKLVEALTAITNWTPRSASLQPSGDAYQRALRERSTALRELQRLRRDIDEARAYAAEQASFVAELEEQKARLSSIGLYEHLAGQELLPVTQALRDELGEVEKELAAATPPTSSLVGYIGSLDEQRTNMLATVQRSDETLDVLSSQVDALRQVRESDLRQAAVIGRISLFIESVRHTSNATPMQQHVGHLRSHLTRLEEQLEGLDKSSNLSEALGQVGGLMRAWATELGHEYRDANWRLDLQHGTVVTRGPRGIVAMNQMGGGQNHLGCHLFAHMALHAWLRGNSAPTPGFVLFDRPTIGLFKDEERSSPKEERPLGAEGQAHLSRILKWLAAVVDGLAGELQVIVTENIRLADEPDLKEFVVENWWDDDGYLVPMDWPSAPEHGKGDGNGQAG